MLKLKNVSKYYYQDGVIAEGFTKANLELHLGEFVVITGESGSGKSTLLNVLSGLDTYEDGEMYINGEETSHYTEEDYLEYRRKYVSNIFQNFNLVNSYTVYQNIELAMLINGKSKKEVKKDVNELIKLVGLTRYRHTLASKLSGGQKQRVAIARSLANDTPIIVADEPTGALDSNASASILKLLHEVSKNKLVIIVTHNKSEIEKYATRLIRMHDGRILENKEVVKVNLDNELQPKSIKDVPFITRFLLGFRNAFNIPVKLILMIVIFLLISTTLLTNYASFRHDEFTELGVSYNYYFLGNNTKRVIITKEDQTAFNENDYNKIKTLNNIDYIVPKDILNEIDLNIDSDNIYFTGKLYLKDLSKVDVGRMPKLDNEIIIIGSHDNYFLNELKDEVFNNTFTIDNISLKDVKIVGILYDDSYTSYDNDFYVSNNIIDKLYMMENLNYRSSLIKLNNTYFGNNQNLYLDLNYQDNIPKGKIYLKEDYNAYCNNYDCSNEIVSITTKDIYSTENVFLEVVVINKDNVSRLLNMQYEDISDCYISKDDYNLLYNTLDYQSSIYVKELKDLNNTVKELNNLGYKTLVLRDTEANIAELITQIFNIFKLIVMIALIFTLFFITYFIMKIIYKSRNSYYTTLRSLGSTKKVCVSILANELVVISTITYIVLIILIYLVKFNIIKFAYLEELAVYISYLEVIVVYLILLLISIIMAKRYGRKIFNNSIMKTYKEKI